MTKQAYTTQKNFFALGTVCTLTAFGGGSLGALAHAKERIMEIHRKSDPAGADNLITRGYAAEEARRILVRENVGEALIVIGETAVNIGSPRRIGLQNPFGTAGENFAYVDIADKAIVSAGLYQQGFEQKSRADRFGGKALAGLTLIGENAVKLSALCNTAAHLDVDSAKALLNDTEVEAIFVTRSQDVAATDGLCKRPTRRHAA